MHRMSCLSVILVAATLSGALTAGAQMSSRHVEKDAAAAAASQEIRALNDRWQTAIDAKSADRSAAMYAPNAVFMPPNAPKVAGSTIYNAWSGMFKTPGMSLKIHPVTITPSDDASMAYDVGTYEFRLEAPKGPAADRGTYLVVWQKVNGEWKVAADIFNSDLPAGK
jgi:ketosteroid isomerase-like protein